MQNSHRTKVSLVSYLLIAAFAQGQPASPPVCQGKPLSIEAQAASAPSKCDGMSPACERISKTSNYLIFVGTVTHIAEAPAPMLLDGACAETKVQTVTLQVKESLSGSLPTTITIHGGYINGYWFRLKETALVFARRFSDGSVLASGCQTEPIGAWFPETNQDLAYLRSRDKLPPTSSLLGNTWAVLPPEINDKAGAVGFGGQSLTISGPVSSRVTTSRNGEFRIDNLPPGKYTIHLDSPLHVYPAVEQQTDLLPKGCAEIRFYIESEADYKRITSAILKARAPK
ncbi:MAG TPA: carboxypeptidase-like regulatory domain-containing protein [Acidobacteriaceae bacterium]|jgi:hypothetical protein